jgi:aspartyl-tRNA(Asn)/glutamyl-tRNA(Gln) amidotransferase subunit C
MTSQFLSAKKWHGRFSASSPHGLGFVGGDAVKISREDVLRVAELAHLELSPEEVETYRGQLDEILSYIAKLEELDVASVEPMAQVIFNPAGDAHPELREDTLVPCDFAPAVLAQAPEAVKPFFRVPRVIEK